MRDIHTYDRDSGPVNKSNITTSIDDFDSELGRVIQSFFKGNFFSMYQVLLDLVKILLKINLN